MTRRTLTLTLISFLLPLAFIVAWIRSHLTTDVIIDTTKSGRYLEFATLPGQFRVTIARGWPAGASWHWYSGQLPRDLIVLGHRPIYKWHPLGYAISDTSGRISARPLGPRRAMTLPYRTYAIPYTLPIALTLILPAFTAIRMRRSMLLAKSRSARGLCPRCGYDLRGSPNRCPECGAIRDSGALTTSDAANAKA